MAILKILRMKWNELLKKEPEFNIDYALVANGDWHKGRLKNIGFEDGKKLFFFVDGNGDPIHDVTHFLRIELPIIPKV